MKRLHRAWAICLGCTLMLFVCGGLSVNAFSVTQPYVLAYGGFTNTQTSMINTIRALSYLGCMFAAPLFFRMLGYRLGTAVAVAFSAVSFAVFSASKTLAGFYLGGVLAGIGYGFGSMIPATILINRWFHRKKGLAIGLCSASTGLAMIVFSPILTAICETRGLQACFLVEAVFSLVCAVLVFLLIRESPEKLSLSAYGAEDGCAPAEPGAQPDAPLPPLPRRRLLPLWLAAGLLGAVASPGPTHLMILYTTAGMAAHAAALAVSLFGVALMVGKCVYGTACDRFGGYRMGWLFGAILCGGGVPLSTVGLAVWSADFGGEARVAQLVQQLQLSYAIGSLLLSTMPGMIADRTGSYAPAYLVLLACSVVSILAVQRTYLARAKS